MHNQPSLSRPEALLGKHLLVALRVAAEDELGLELPLEVNVPLVLGALVDDGVVVLQVGAAALGLERAPHHVLVHGRGVLAPLGEVGCVEWEGGLEVLDWLGVFEEEDLEGRFVSWGWSCAGALEDGMRGEGRGGGEEREGEDVRCRGRP